MSNNVEFDELAVAAKRATRATKDLVKSVRKEKAKPKAQTTRKPRQKKVAVVEHAEVESLVEVVKHAVEGVAITEQHKDKHCRNYTASPYGPSERRMSRPDKWWRGMQRVAALKRETAAILRKRA